MSGSLVTDSSRGKRLVLGVDVGGTKTAVGLVDDEGRVEHRLISATPTHDAELVLGLIVASAREILATTAEGQVTAVGVGVPGSIDSEAGICRRAANLAFRDFPMKARLESELGLPVYLENDTNAAVLAEARFGAGRGLRDVIYVTVGTGVGSGIVRSGEAYRGAHGEAGEIGHIVVSRDGPPCACGAFGCLEAVVGGPAVAERVRRVTAERPGSLLADLVRLSGSSAQVAFDAAAQGDAEGQRVVDEVASYLAMGLISVLRLLDPDVIAIGGGMASAGDRLLLPIRRAVERIAPSAAALPERIVLTALGENAGLLGAGTLALRGIPGDRAG